MEVCYYCEETEAVNKRYGKPACEDCFEAQIHTSGRPQQLSEEEAAWRFKIILSTFKHAFSEKE
ncbi:hypothetical protein MUB16_34840 [Priestia sp. OVL9]|nr:hypothetical protein [Priestia sp. OVL9]MCJ7987797.1 hypothetical protein [Priestia sp. OVL9]MCJ7987835.1 hypothetical protein [Priestia sp. OVL9]